MSQFSESYHLRSTKQTDAVELIKKSKTEGIVLEAQNGWVTFVVNGGQFKSLNSIVNNNNGLLLHYVYAEDHEWSFSLFLNEIEICHYSCEWGLGVLNINKSRLFYQAFNTNDLFESELEFMRIMNTRSLEKLFELQPFYNFADKLKLPHYEWVSFDYVKNDDERFKELIYIQNP